ncbi:unnamed protein product [Aphanomyces euteiches]
MQDARILQMDDSDAVIDEIATRFHRSVYVSKNPDLVVAQKLYTQAKTLHLSNMAEYRRHLTRLDGLDPKQKCSVRPRAWKFIEQANFKLTTMDSLVRDFEMMVRPKNDAIQKILDKLMLLHSSIEHCGQDAIRLIIHEIQSLESFMGLMNGVFTDIFTFLSLKQVANCRLVASSWNKAITVKRLISYAIETPNQRQRLWMHAIQSRMGGIPEHDYHALVAEATSDRKNQFYMVIEADVRRTTFVRAEHIYQLRSRRYQRPWRLGTQAVTSAGDSKLLNNLHLKLARILKAYCQLDPSVGYCHGMTFLAATILSCLGYDEAASFHVLVACMLQYDMAEMFRIPDLPGTKRRMDQLDKLVRIHLPAMGKCLLQHKIHPQMYSSGWVMSLFLNESSLSPATACVLLDEFLLGGWPAMFRIYLGLLSLNASRIITPHFNRSLQALVQLPKQLETSLLAAIEEGNSNFVISAQTLDMLAANYDPVTSLMDYF